MHNYLAGQLMRFSSKLSGDNSLDYLKEKILVNRMGPEELKAQQLIKLRALVNYSYKNVPYYRNIFDRYRIKPEDIDSLEAFASIPVLNKKIITAHKDDFISEKKNVSNLVACATGGATGNPLNFYRSKKNINIGRTGLWRSFLQCGWQPGDNIAYVWGEPKGYFDKSRLRRTVSSFAKRVWYFNTFDTSEEVFSKWVSSFRMIKPKLIYGYACSIDLFAQYVLANNVSIKCVKGVFTTAETLFDSARNNIEKAFRCKAYNYYGSSEVLNIACECPNGNMHVNTDYVAIEEGDVKDENGNCEFIMTSLDNYAMPFLRYTNGDMGKISNKSCSCGLNFPLIELNIGRIGNIIKFPNGNIVSGHFFEYMIYGTNGIASFQFYQKEVSEISLRIVKSIDFNNDTQKLLYEIPSMIKEKGGPINVNIEFVDFIPLTKNGKHAYILSEIN